MGTTGHQSALPDRARDFLLFNLSLWGPGSELIGSQLWILIAILALDWVMFWFWLSFPFGWAQTKALNPNPLRNWFINMLQGAQAFLEIPKAKVGG